MCPSTCNVLTPQDRGLWTRQLGDNSNGFHFQVNSTSSEINELEFAIPKSVRSIFITLAVFNIVAAVGTALAILWDCCQRAKRSKPTFGLWYDASLRTWTKKNRTLSTKSSLLGVIGTAEVFPFILSIGLVAQGIIYLVAHVQGLDSLFIQGCTPISQAMLPALFIVPYVQLIFGLETTIQALRRRPFPKQSKWTVPTCVGIVFVGLVGNYAATRFVEPLSICYPSLFWFVQTWGLESFCLLVGIIFILLVGAGIISIRLHRNGTVNALERTKASRMVYFMVLGVVLNGLIAPFFYSISFQDPLVLNTMHVRLAMVATVAGTVSGIAFGVLTILLRFGKMRKVDLKSHVELYRLQPEDHVGNWTAGLGIYNAHMECPVSLPKLLKSPSNAESPMASKPEKNLRNEPYFELQGKAKGLGPNATQLAERLKEGFNMAEVARRPLVQPRQCHSNGESYRLFPNHRGDASDVKPRSHLLATAYAPIINATAPYEGATDMLIPPAKVYAPGTILHQRGSSLVSSATVQIGLRVSNVSDMARLASPFFQQSCRLDRLRGLNTPFDSALMVQSPRLINHHRHRNSVEFDSNDPYHVLPQTTHWRGDGKSQGEEEITLSPTIYSPPETATLANSNYEDAAFTVSLPGKMLASENRFKVETEEWI